MAREHLEEEFYPTFKIGFYTQWANKLLVDGCLKEGSNNIVSSLFEGRHG